MSIEKEFIELRLIVEEASSQGDFRRNNKAMKSLQKIFKNFEKDVESASVILSDLLKHENNCVRAGAAAFCLSLKIHLKEAEQALKDVAKKSDSKIVSFNAKSTLEIWKDQGYLKMYPEQK